MNPLSRNYESNGPDVKVRGNAAHIAEKYVQLARDAHASGDSVMAENYLQHAEHYFRIVSAAQPQMRPDQPGQEAETIDDDEDYGGDEQSRFDTPQFRASLQAERYQDDRQQQRNEQPQQNNQQRDTQPRDVPPARVEANADSNEGQETVAAAEAPAVEASEPEGDAEPRRRERRPRRRRQPSGEGAVDPNGPQPDVGDLPAFITAGGATNAAE